MPIIVIVIIAVTLVMSAAAFQNHGLMEKWIMRPYLVKERNQWYRLITSGFIHANWPHLLVNMLVFYSFAQVVYAYYVGYFATTGIFLFLALYLGGIIVSDLPTYFKHKDDAWYASLGASGAVSSITFAFILMEPLSKIYLMGILKMPAIVWGVAYLAYSQYASRKGGDNINHSAHFTGAVFGIVFTLILRPAFATDFIDQLLQR